MQTFLIPQLRDELTQLRRHKSFAAFAMRESPKIPQLLELFLASTLKMQHLKKQMRDVIYGEKLDLFRWRFWIHGKRLFCRHEAFR